MMSPTVAEMKGQESSSWWSVIGPFQYFVDFLWASIENVPVCEAGQL